MGCNKGIAESDPVSIPKPVHDVNLDDLFARTLVNDEVMYCAGFIDYRLFKVDYEAYRERCELCPGWDE